MARDRLNAELEEERQRLESANASWTVWWQQTGRREMRCIVMTAWDPVGIGDTVQAWDEYDTYVPGIANRLRDVDDRDTAVNEVSAYLDHIEQDWMGELHDGRAKRNRHLAYKLVAWHYWSFTCHGQEPRQCSPPPWDLPPR